MPRRVREHPHGASAFCTFLHVAVRRPIELGRRCSIDDRARGRSATTSAGRALRPRRPRSPRHAAYGAERDRDQRDHPDLRCRGVAANEQRRPRSRATLRGSVGRTAQQDGHREQQRRAGPSDEALGQDRAVPLRHRPRGGEAEHRRAGDELAPDQGRTAAGGDDRQRCSTPRPTPGSASRRNGAVAARRASRAAGVTGGRVAGPDPVAEQRMCLPSAWYCSESCQTSGLPDAWPARCGTTRTHRCRPTAATTDADPWRRGHGPIAPVPRSTIGGDRRPRASCRHARPGEPGMGPWT